MSETVSWGIAAFCSHPNASDEEIVDVLAGAGVPRALAARTVLMLPLAFGRHLLRDMIEAPDEIVEGDVTRALSTDPVFVAAADAAPHATRTQMERIALRSSEVNAVNAALHAGSKPDGLVMSAPHTGPSADAEPDPAWAQTLLDELVRRHGSTRAWTARVFPHELTKTFAKLQLDVVVAADDRRTIVESFAGMGATIADATAEAMKKLALSSLHVIIAALDGIDTDQVTWEGWGPFRACVGRLLQQWATPPPIDFAPYLDAVKTKLLEEPLSRELHWHRTFVAVGENELFGIDALVDNERWPAGAKLVEEWPWPRQANAYALRHFLMLVPA